MLTNCVKKILSVSSLIFLAACSGGGDDTLPQGSLYSPGVFGPEVTGTPDSFRGAGIARQEQFLFGGPLRRSRSGDILLQNDNLRVIIQKPGRNSGVGLFGGNIIDADRFRPSSEPGQDHFGHLYPFVNMAWTINYQRLEVMNGDFAKGPVVVRATGTLDVYDYIQTNIIVPFAQIFKKITLNYADKFDDVFDPFEHVKSLQGLNTTMVTDYILEANANNVRLETHFQNRGEVPLVMPVGDWVNGSGSVQLFMPKGVAMGDKPAVIQSGFVRTPLVDNVSALVYQALEEDVAVSYGYFYDPIQFADAEGKLIPAASLSVSGVTPMVLGEGGLLNLFPLGEGEPTVNFTIEPGQERVVTRYFIVGTGDTASVMDEGQKVLQVSTLRATGQVVDSKGNPVRRASVVVLDKDDPVTIAFTDAQGNFSAEVSSGTDAKDQMFGSGAYTFEVYKEGYSTFAPKGFAGTCTQGQVDNAAKTIAGVQCELGQTSMVSVSVNSDGQPGPARVTIVGFDPSPIHPYGMPGDFGKYYDVNLEERPYGIVDTLYLDSHGKLFNEGNPRRVSDKSFLLEPGEYEIFFTRGMEYSVDSHRIQVSAGGNVQVQGSIKKVVDTSGYVSGDFHLHGINSPDSAYRIEQRIRNSMAEGMDIIVGTDHEYVSDYPGKLAELGYGDTIASFSGDEITPLAYGHMITWPLKIDPSRPDHGAYDYTYQPSDDLLNPDHDMVQSMAEIIRGVDAANPGTQVFSVAHITDKSLGNFSIAHLVTSPNFSVPLLSTYADPVRFRLPPNSNEAGGYQAPFPLGTSEMFTLDFTSVGLTIGTFSEIFEHMKETSLPTYFNLLNLGKVVSATGDSDTHAQVREPNGIPRNFVASSVDPRDGVGSFAEIDQEEIAQNVNAGKVIITNGIFVRAQLKSADNSQNVSVGGTVQGTGQVTLELDIASNEYFDWDTVEVYANTQPVPAKDDLSGVTDLDPETFHTADLDHIAKYFISPVVTFQKQGGDEPLPQVLENGARKSHLSYDFDFGEDTWIVVLVYGSDQVRSTFPYVPKEATVPAADAVDSPNSPKNFLDTLDNDPVLIGGIRAFALTNPMFVDIDGDGFQPIYIKDGTSPLVGM